MPDTGTASEDAPRRSGGHGAALAAVTLAVLTGWLFLPAMRNGFVNWDDPELLLRNFRFRDFGPDSLAWMFSNVLLGHFHPFTWISYALDHAVWGMSPAGYHATNLLLHAVNAALVFLLARRLAPAAGLRAGAAWLFPAVAAALWAWHPLRVEAVAWVTARRDVLSAFFQLLATLAWLRAVGDGSRRAAWRLGALACFASAVLSKGTAVMLPAVWLVLDVFPLGRRRDGESPAAFARRMLAEKAPFLAIAAAGAAVAWLASRASGAMRSWDAFGLTDRLVQAGYAIAFYAGKSVVPADLSPLYRLPEHPALVAWPVAAGFAAVLLAGGALFLLRRKIPAAAASAACAAVLLVPVLGFAQSGPQFAADRYTYLPAAALAPLIAGALARLWSFLAARIPARVAGVVLGSALLLAVLGFARWTRAEIGMWRDGLTLWTRALAVDPDSPIALNNRGHALEEAGDADGALADYDRAVFAAPGSVQARLSRGTLLARAGRTPAAQADFEAALALDPDSAEAHNGLGNLKKAAGDAEGALRSYSRAIAAKPDYADALYNRGLLRSETGDAPGARRDFDAAIRIAPDNAAAWHNRGVLRHKQGDLAGALDDYARALALDPSLEPAYRKAGLLADPSAAPAAQR